MLWLLIPPWLEKSLDVYAWNHKKCYEKRHGIYMFGNVMASNSTMVGVNFENIVPQIPKNAMKYT